MRNFSVTLDSGVVLDTVEAGDPNGKPVFFIHGTPGSRDLYRPQAENAEKLGIRLISYSRPGYGNSTRHKGRNIKDAASDVEGIADHLGLERFSVWGHSGGGPHALACAAMLPRRVAAMASLAGVAPYNAEGLDYFAGTGEYNVQDTKLLQRDQDQWEKKNIEDIKEMTSGTREGVVKGLSTLLSEADRNALSDELVDYLLVGTREGCSHGVKGLLDDELAFLNPWGFDPAIISVPTQIWHGKKDLFVPFSHGEWISGKIAVAETHFFESEGHLSLFVKKNYEIQKWLASYL